MLEFIPLELHHKTIFEKFLTPYNFKTCEYSFINLFIWRKACNIKFATYNDSIIIKKTGFDFKDYFMPPLGYTKNNLKDIVDKLIPIKNQLNLDYLFKDAEESFLTDLKSIYGDKLIIEEDRDNFDYIYDSSKLISLSGKKLHSKKNHYNNFIKNNNYRVEDINCSNISACIETAQKWCDKNICEGYLLHELHAIFELLNNRKNLDFKGIVVYVDDVLSAFTIGEKINEYMAIIHIEKADSDINGLYNFINKAFIEKEFANIPLINREQDLGLEGLRKAKLSYQPLRLEPKYAINISI